tara:strand:- start:585 stop:779 length:195 start_codon:yes stop_codon:yes gene_type:complete
MLVMMHEEMALAIKNWEKEYLQVNRKRLTNQQVEILEGRELKSNEGMVFGQMYSDWKKSKGYEE